MRPLAIGRRQSSLARFTRQATLVVAAITTLAIPLLRAPGTQPASAPAPRDTSCFLGTIAHPQSKAIADSTVFIAVVRADGTLLSQGTGFIAAGSAALGTTGPRIVTAAHVAVPQETMPDDARFMIFFSDGEPIGEPRVVASGEMHSVSLGSFDIDADDIAVLEIARFTTDTARTRFNRLAGLPINRDGVLRVGEASEPIGAIWGFSGAAAVDQQGRVIGVLTGADFRGRVTLELGSIEGANMAGGPLTRPVTLPRRALIVVEPLHDDAILRALGPGVTHQIEPSAAATVMAGFPLASCASTNAVLESPASSEGVALLSRWQAIGQEDAWFLPPRLDATKLRLAP